MQVFSKFKKIQTFGKSRNASKSALLFEYMRECNFLGCIGFIVALRFTPKHIGFIVALRFTPKQITKKYKHNTPNQPITLQK